MDIPVIEALIALAVAFASLLFGAITVSRRRRQPPRDVATTDDLARQEIDRAAETHVLRTVEETEDIRRETSGDDPEGALADRLNCRAP